MSEPYLGEIRMFGGKFAPQNYATCDGQTLEIQQNKGLFSVFGFAYGGDGKTLFRLPDMRGRAPISHGRLNGAGPVRNIGYSTGSENVALTEGEMPPHEHQPSALAFCVSQPGNANTPVNHHWSRDRGTDALTYDTGPPDATMNEGAMDISSTNAGASAGHQNMQPFLTITFVTALVGLFPPRN